MPNQKRNPRYPIIFVRGYAGSESGVEETVATPFMGFNLGSTKIRQRWDGNIRRHVFESPLVRLMKDHGYSDVYSHGDVLAVDQEMPERSVIIYRYYDQVSADLGAGVRPDIEVFAEGLNDLIERIRKQVCMNGKVAQADFKVYLVAHSMGGLICRAFLQNHALGTSENRNAVDKVFTYATPHNGIDIKVIGNLPGFFSRNNANNFNRKHMKEYLNIQGGDVPANSLDHKFDTNRFFSLVGTNSKDYAVAGGWSSRVVGESSDGLVRLENAVVNRTPRAFVHRSHSGHYGIVNSEEGYQNLTRFLFGDVQVCGKLKIKDIRLPTRVEKARLEGKEIRASYHIESVIRTRGARYDLSRRLVNENSSIFRTYEELKANRHPRLFSAYLCKEQRCRSGHGPLVFALDLAVQVPEYEIDRAWRSDLHVDGSYLFRQTIILAAVPPKRGETEWGLHYGFNATSNNPTPRKAKRLSSQTTDGALTFQIPIRSELQRPGLDAMLEISTKPWG